MSSPRLLHNRAMRLADQGLFLQAMEVELDAASKLSESSGLAWSILMRSAAALALKSKNSRMAEKVASRALATDLHPDVIDEVRDIWERASFDRHLEYNHLELGRSEVLLSLVGPSAADGMTFLSELTDRVVNLERLIYRIAQRLMNKAYGRLTKEVLGSFRAFAAVPTSGSFAIAIRLAHAQPAQTSFPGMLGTEMVVDELLDLLEIADGPYSDRIAERIPDEAYRTNFIGLSRKLAPDGDRIKQVGFAAHSRDGIRKLSVTTHANEFLPVKLPDTYGPLSTISGYLRFASARTNRIKIETVDGKPEEVDVPEALVDDIVRPLWNFHVTAEVARNKRQKLLRLQRIWESDPETGVQVGSPVISVPARQIPFPYA